MILQYIISILGIIAILQGYSRYSQAKQTFRMFLFWTCSWIFMIMVVIFPQVTTFISEFLNIKRPIDAIVLPSIAILYYVVFILYVKIDELNNQITKIVRMEAIRNSELKIKKFKD